MLSAVVRFPRCITASDIKLSIRQTNSLRFSFPNHETRFNENYDMTLFVEQFNEKKTQQETPQQREREIHHKYTVGGREEKRQATN